MGTVVGVMQASDGAIYVSSMANAPPHTSGAIYKIYNNTASLFYSFGSSGGRPSGPLVEASDGNFYGTTLDLVGNLAHPYGSVFRLTPAGVLTTLHTFNGTDGYNPKGGLIQATDGLLYVTTTWGGHTVPGTGHGTIFKITTGGSFTLLHTFNGTIGSDPRGGLTEGSDGNFYGTTFGEHGSIFKMTPGGTVTSLHQFLDHQGYAPECRLVEGTNGAFYGSTAKGGLGSGAIFKVTPAGDFTTLHLFPQSPDESDLSFAAMCLGADGSIYGGAAAALDPAVPGRLFRILDENSDQPVLALQPIGYTNVVGSSVSLKSAAVGLQPLSYQWQKDGTAIPGATASSLSLAAANATASGDYTVVITNIVGAITSSVATVSIVEPVDPYSSPIEIVHNFTGDDQPSRYAIQAANGDFYATRGYGTKGGSSIPNATASALVLNNVTTNDVGVYSVVVSIGSISVTSSNATLSLLDKPTITTHPASQTIYAGSNSTLTVVASGTPPLAYQWYKDGNPLSGATDTSLTIANAQISDYGTYSVVVANASGPTTSNPALMTVKRLVSIYSGLFYETNAVRHETAGYIKMTVKGTNFSGKILLEGLGSSFSGKLLPNGVGTKIITRSNLDRENLTITFQIDHAKDQVVGMINGSGWTAPLLADGYPFSLTHLATNYVGTYTMLFPGFDDAATGPIGDGHGAAAINTLGKVKLAYGALPDGQVIKSAVTISEGGTWPLYSPVYPIKVTNLLGRVRKEYKGSVIGWMTVTNNAPEGAFSWIKTGWTNTIYTAGFTNEADVISSRYIYTPGTRAMNATNALLTFTGGGLPADFSANVLLKTNVTMSAVAPLTNSTGTGLTPKYGIFKGTFRHPANTNAATRYSGAILQKQNFGAGFFVHTNATGAVSLTPQ